jgi:hypothetical protein
MEWDKNKFLSHSVLSLTDLGDDQAFHFFAQVKQIGISIVALALAMVALPLQGLNRELVMKLDVTGRQLCSSGFEMEPHAHTALTLNQMQALQPRYVEIQGCW